MARQARAVATRQQIITGAARMFEQSGFEGASLGDIVDGSGTTKGALYFHFRSKDELARVVIEEQHRTSIESVRAVTETGASPLRQLVMLCHEMARQIIHDPVVRAGMRLTLEFGGSSEPAQPYVEWIANAQQIVEHGIEQGEITSTVDPASLARFVIGSFTGVQTRVAGPHAARRHRATRRRHVGVPTSRDRHHRGPPRNSRRFVRHGGPRLPRQNPGSGPRGLNPFSPPCPRSGHGGFRGFPPVSAHRGERCETAEHGPAHPLRDACDAGSRCSARFYCGGRVGSPTRRAPGDHLFQTAPARCWACSMTEKFREDIGRPGTHVATSGITSPTTSTAPRRSTPWSHAAVRAGAALVKHRQQAAFGGYHGHFADPNGVIWEICHQHGLERRRRRTGAVDDGHLRAEQREVPAPYGAGPSRVPAARLRYSAPSNASRIGSPPVAAVSEPRTWSSTSLRVFRTRSFGVEATATTVVHHRPRPVHLLLLPLAFEFARITRTCRCRSTSPRNLSTRFLERAHREHGRLPQRVVRVDNRRAPPSARGARARLGLVLAVGIVDADDVGEFEDTFLIPATGTGAGRGRGGVKEGETCRPCWRPSPPTARLPTVRRGYVVAGRPRGAPSSRG